MLMCRAHVWLQCSFHVFVFGFQLWIFLWFLGRRFVLFIFYSYLMVCNPCQFHFVFFVLFCEILAVMVLIRSTIVHLWCYYHNLFWSFLLFFLLYGIAEYFYVPFYFFSVITCIRWIGCHGLHNAFPTGGRCVVHWSIHLDSITYITGWN